MGRLPRTVLLLGLASLFGDVASEMIFPLLPVFLAGTLGAGPTFLGLVEGVADTVASVLKLVSGSLVDRLGRHKLLVGAGYAVSSLARPLVAFASAPWHVLAVRATDRVGKGVRTSPRDALLADAVDRDAAGTAFGFHRAMDHAGAVIGPLVASALLAAGVELRMVFLAAVVPGLASVLAVTLVRPRAAADAGDGGTASRSGPSPGAARSLPAEAPPVAADPSAPRSPADRPARLPRRFTWLVVILGLFAVGHASDAFLVLRASELGVADADIPLLWTVFHFAKVLLVSAGGRLADRVDRSLLLAGALLTSALAYVGFAFASTPTAVVALFVFYAIYYGLSEPTERALVRDLAPAGARGRAYGWYNAIVGGAALPAGLLVGGVWEGFGAPVALGMGAASALVAAGALLVWRRSA